MKKYAWLLPLLSGVLMGLPLVFPCLFLLSWIGAVPGLFYLYRRAFLRKGGFFRFYTVGLSYFLPYYLTAYHWFTAFADMAFMDVPFAEKMLLVLICWLGLSLLQSVVAALIFPIFAGVTRLRAFRERPLLWPPLFAALYAVFEWIQTLTWAGVPFARLIVGQGEGGVLLNSLSLFGPYFLTFLLVAANAFLALAFFRPRFFARGAYLALAALVLAFGSGAVGFLLSANSPSPETVCVAAVQGNVGSSAKWDRESTEKSFEVYRAYTAAAAAAGARVVVFPETFVPETLSADSQLGLYIRDLAATYGITVVCGAFDEETSESGELSYNAVFTVTPDGRIQTPVYHKRRLVPFGEYLPMKKFVTAIFPPLADLNLGDELTPGTNPAVTNGAGFSMGYLICFDSIYENLTAGSVADGAQILCVPTNDSWFGPASALSRHLTQARMRAIESGRPVIRAADTGISAMIDRTGRVRSALPADTSGVLVSELPLGEGRTLYGHLGNAFLWPCVLFAPAVLLWDFLKQRKKQK